MSQQFKAAKPAPTQNPYYNALLRTWAAQGHPCNPECEDCGKDLTGEKVHDTGVSWVCDRCLQVADEEIAHYDVRENFSCGT